MTLVADHLGVRFGRRMALDDVCATAGAGRITAVVGPNAAGKSTLLRALAGLIRPTTGRAIEGDSDVQRMSARSRAARLAYVAQRPQVSAAFTVRQVVALGRFALAPSPQAVETALDELSVADLGERIFNQLSVGQQQRVMLARALAQAEARGNLILDEPTSAMDLAHTAAALRVLRQRAARGATVIVAMHDLASAMAFADEAWLLQGGRLVASGAAHEVFTPAQLEAVFGVTFSRVRAGERELVLPLPG